MPIITLTTDWGSRDYHVAALKGALLSSVPDVQIVDITHDVSRHNIQQAAFIFRNALRFFPSGTMHLIALHGHTGTTPGTLCIKKDNHMFMGLNDGFFSLVFDEEPIDMVEFPRAEQEPVQSIPRMVHCAVHLLHGKNVYELGSRPDQFVRRGAFQPSFTEELIRGVVVYIDHFGNVVTNISRELFEKQRAGRRFEIILRKTSSPLDSIRVDYSEVDQGDVLALFNEAGLLEIAINQGNAHDLLYLRPNDHIRIEFK
jgi:S-adenosylmethionine hydrolase